MRYEFSDGGRADAGYKGTAGDCAVRAIAIATGRDYKEVYDGLKAHLGSTPRNGVQRKALGAYLETLGWEWVATKYPGSGTVHLTADELPADTTIITRLSRHFAAVINGTVFDNHDPRRNGTRMVYGYWRAA